MTNPNEQNFKERGAALLHAAEFGDVKDVRAQLDAGAPINFQAWTGRTPITEAARRGENSVVQLLVDRGADPNIPDVRGRTALMMAWDPSTARILLTAGAHVDAQDESGETALQCRAIDSSTNETLQLLLDHGADTTIVNRLGNTAEDQANKANKPVLVAHREQGILRQAAGLDANQDELVQRSRKM